MMTLIHCSCSETNNGEKYTVVYNDHPRDPKLVAVVDRWSLFIGSFVLKIENGTLSRGGRNQRFYKC